MCTPEGRRLSLVTASREQRLARSGRAWALRDSIGRSGGVGAGPGKRSCPVYALGGSAVGVVSHGNRACSRGLARLAASICGEEVGIRFRWRAAIALRALRVLCRYARKMWPPIRCSARSHVRARVESATAHAGRRRRNSRPDVACCGGEAAGSLSHCGDMRIRALADARARGGAIQVAGPLRRRDTLGLRGCTKKSVVQGMR